MSSIYTIEIIQRVIKLREALMFTKIDKDKNYFYLIM